MPAPWDNEEIRRTVEDYFTMLSAELRDERYNKAEHNRELRRHLEDRSHGAVERKHQNISAILVEMEIPYIDGYKPLFNYQADLGASVREFLRANPGLIREFFLHGDHKAISQPSVQDFRRIVTSPPELRPASSDRNAGRPAMLAHFNFVAQEARNQKLGHLGEKLVVDFERARLKEEGRSKLARKVEWVSKTQGDGAGYDVLSFDGTGGDLLIEVKTTNHGRSFPFYVTRNELHVSRKHEDQYSLYRVFNFRRGPRLFVLKGAVDRHCHLDPQSYRASFGEKVG